MINKYLVSRCDPHWRFITFYKYYLEALGRSATYDNEYQASQSLYYARRSFQASISASLGIIKSKLKKYLLSTLQNRNDPNTR